MSHPLVEAIGNSVKPHAKPCVNISGGIDSTIILHHLTEKTSDPIYTYTVGFTGQEPEFIHAQRVADYYDTHHKEIIVENMIDRYPEILPFFAQPRFNLWPYWAAEQAKLDNRLSCYIGEGGDEHFGGYWYKPPKSYVENWSSFFHFVYPTYKTIYDSFKLQLIVPMHPSNLSWEITYPYYDVEQEKRLLREAYKGVLPDFVVARRKLNGRKDYWVMWKQELEQRFPNVKPTCEDDIRLLWNLVATEIWLNSQRLKVSEKCFQIVSP